MTTKNTDDQNSTDLRLWHDSVQNLQSPNFPLCNK